MCRVYSVLVLIIVVILSSEAFAQQSAPADIVLTGAESVSAARLFAASEVEAIPNNIEIPSDVRRLVREMWLRSPTFRRQCARIAQAFSWRIQISFRGVPFSDAWAKTNFDDRDGFHRANVVLVAADTRTVELIGHEFEHVLEQFDGVDLVRSEGAGARGVRRLSSHGFETERAIDIGKRVAREYALAGQRASSR
jgi:hypothetical protein